MYFTNEIQKNNSVFKDVSLTIRLHVPVLIIILLNYSLNPYNFMFIANFFLVFNWQFYSQLSYFVFIVLRKLQLMFA